MAVLALAIAFHEVGLHVYATARDASKMTQVKSRGIETIVLDVLSETSIAACVAKLSSLDILVNNAGAMLTMPVADLSIVEAKKVFDVNVWSHVVVTQAFLPLLVKSSRPMIVNQTSISSLLSVPLQSTYGASKAAMAMFSNAMRLELKGLGIAVVDLKTGIVKSNLIRNNEKRHPTLPKGSLYEPARELIEKSLRQEEFADSGDDASEWASLVVKDLLEENPLPVIWRGELAAMMQDILTQPIETVDEMVKKITGMEVVENILRNRAT